MTCYFVQILEVLLQYSFTNQARKHETQILFQNEKKSKHFLNIFEQQLV